MFALGVELVLPSIIGSTLEEPHPIELSSQRPRQRAVSLQRRKFQLSRKFQFEFRRCFAVLEAAVLPNHPDSCMHTPSGTKHSHDACPVCEG